MANKAVSNTGPIIHLNEINLLNILEIFQILLIPEEVAKELRKNKIMIPKKIKIISLNPQSKDSVKVLTNQENLDLGESCAIALALQERVDYFLTDDLEARSVAEKYNLETHGSIGIVLRAFKEKIINEKIAIEKIGELYSKSSLFITKDLVDNVLRSIKEFKR